MSERPDSEKLLLIASAVADALEEAAISIRKIFAEELEVIKRRERTLESVVQAFPKDLAELLYFEDAGDHILVRPKGYLGSERFQRILEIVRNLGGEYVSTGKDSHFKVPKKFEAFASKTESEKAPPLEAPPERPKTLLEEVEASMPADLKGLVAFEDTPSSVLVRPREYLSSEPFKRINNIIRDRFKGEYVSAGKDSHWRIDKPEAKPMAQFDPEELMRHEWKGKKKAGGGYTKGSLSWGWDFASEFSPAVVEALKKGPLKIDGYEFSLASSQKIVRSRKVKESG